MFLLILSRCRDIDIMGFLFLLGKSDVLCMRSFMFMFIVFLHNLSPACLPFDKIACGLFSGSRSPYYKIN